MAKVPHEIAVISLEAGPLSHGLYPKLDGVSHETPQMEWRFLVGSVVQFAHPDEERTVNPLSMLPP